MHLWGGVGLWARLYLVDYTNSPIWGLLLQGAIDMKSQTHSHPYIYDGFLARPRHVCVCARTRVRVYGYVCMCILSILSQVLGYLALLYNIHICIFSLQRMKRGTYDEQRHSSVCMVTIM